MRHFNRFSCLILILLWAMPFGLSARESSAPSIESKQLIFLFSPANKPPFWYFEADQPRGIMFDLLQQACNEHGYRLAAQGASRNRSHAQVADNPLMVVGHAAEWIKNPDQFAVSDPVISNPDILLSSLENPVDFEKSPKELKGLIISTHIGYVYPTVDPLFKNNTLIRSDTQNEFDMLKRVYKQRTQAALISRPVARWYIKQNRWQQRFYLSPKILSNVELRLVFHPSQSRFIELFNQSLQEMRQNGQYQQIIDRYQ